MYQIISSVLHLYLWDTIDDTSYDIQKNNITNFKNKMADGCNFIYYL